MNNSKGHQPRKFHKLDADVRKRDKKKNTVKTKQYSAEMAFVFSLFGVEDNGL
jgi:hypothetical protein